MTMLSFRVDDHDAVAVAEWATRLGIERSELLRQAVRLHLNRLASEQDVQRWRAKPATKAELAVRKIADWGPAEDWSDWTDGAR